MDFHANWNHSSYVRCGLWRVQKKVDFFLASFPPVSRRDDFHTHAHVRTQLERQIKEPENASYLHFVSFALPANRGQFSKVNSDESCVKVPAFCEWKQSKRNEHILQSKQLTVLWMVRRTNVSVWPMALAACMCECIPGKSKSVFNFGTEMRKLNE